MGYFKTREFDNLSQIESNANCQLIISALFFFGQNPFISYPELGIVSRAETTLSYETHTDVTTQGWFNLHAPEACKGGACLHIKTYTF